MKTKHVLLLVIVLLSAHAYAQMWNGQDTLYGNEWINYDQSYFKIPVAEDGIYRLSTEVMEAAGIPLNQIQSNQLQLFHLGEEQALYVSNNGLLTNDDYIEFYGEKNRSEVDQYLFESIDSSMLNPWYSLITDTSVYYLTWNESGTSGLRYETINNDLTNLPPKEEWYWESSEVYFTNDLRKIYTKMGDEGPSVYYSRYGGEGFASDYAVQHNLDISTPGFYNLGPESFLNLRFVSNANNDGHNLEVKWNDGLIAAETYNGAQIRSYNINLNTSDLINSNSIQLQGLNNNDSYAVGGAIVHYPRTFNANGATFLPIELPEANGDRYLELDDIGNGTQACLLYDQTNLLRLEPIDEDGVWKAKFPAAIDERHLIAFTDIQTINAIQSVEFVDLTASEGEYLILTSERLRNNGQGIDYVQQYADYRSSATGGAYNVKIVNVETLYDQYSYGIERHPIAIRNFVHLAQKEWQNLKYCFLIGKGQEYNAIRNQASLEAAISEGFFHLPSYGWPASDNLLFAQPGEVVPSLPVGRIAVINGDEVGIYLDKVESMEANFNNPQTIEDRAWMKNVLHLGGGSSASEQSTIKAYLENMAAEIRRNKYGGNVKAFYKTSADPIQISLSDQIFNTINEGTSIITFFGHSSPGTFDFNIDNPDNYLNAGKYPLMLSLGCYSGNVFVNGRSIGERFTFYENKATVAFGASRGLGFISSLGNFARTYYAHLGEAFYGEGIGDALLATLHDHKNNAFIGTATLVEQFTLHADPAIRLYPTPGPDYVLDPASVSFLPEVVTADQDSFGFNTDVLNLGQNIPDTVVLRVLRKLPNNNLGKEVVRDTVALNQFRHSFSYQIPTEGRDGVGENLLLPIIDVANDVEELPYPDAEGNNFLKRSNGEEGIPLFIIDNTARPVHPYEFAIVGEAPITLKASTTDALAPERTYLLEIDTTALFNSTQKRNTSITQKGGVIEWTPPVNWQDSTVYYWRISPDSTSVEVGYVWEESSFVYVEGSEKGWRQGAYWQFRKNEGENILIDSLSEKLRFTSNFTDLRIKNKVYESSDRPNGYINNSRWSDFFRWEVPQSINIVVFDSLGRIMWNDLPGQYGSLNTTATKEIACFPFPVETVEERLNIVNFLDDIVESGSTVFFYNALRNLNYDLNIDDWGLDSLTHPGGKNIFTVIEEEGGVYIRELSEAMRPYLIIYEKGHGVIWEEIADTLTSTIDYVHSVEGFWNNGTFYSPRIGPSKEWKSMFWDNTLIEPSDSIRLDLIGYDIEGNKEVIMENLISQELLDLSFINASELPYLSFELFCMDTIFTSAPRLNNWFVVYEPMPDFALNPAFNYFFHADTLQEGDSLILRTVAENLYYDEADSLGVSLQIYNSNYELKEEKDYAILIENGRALIDATLDTKGLRGTHQLSLILNNDQSVLENYLTNNQLNQPFHVTSDIINPILYVTFDGVHIQNGDLVSASPTIHIELEDENPYFVLDDTSSFNIRLTSPDGSQKIIRFSDPEIIFEPAVNADENKAIVIYRPEFLESGLYQLTVQAEDIIGNKGGKIDYNVEFEVIIESSVTNVLNYPNPFVNKTNFVYTLTGKAPPTEFFIRIMTVSGRIIKTIPLHLYENLKIGTHRTEYQWDGRDDYGDQLANGVYLYQVFVRGTDGEEFEHRSSAIDGYFRNGVGKMVILR